MTQPPDVALADLLAELFDAEELQRFLRRNYREIADCLPTNMGRIPLASAAAEALVRRKLADEALFGRLDELRARGARKLDVVARASDRSDMPSPPRRWPVWAAMAVAAGGVAGALLVYESPVGSTRCESLIGCAEGGTSDVLASARASRGAAPRRSDPTFRCASGMALIHDIGQAGPMCLDRTEVTRRAFCSSVTGSVKVDPRDKQASRRCLPDPGYVDWFDHPIVHVRPWEAVAYCAERGLVLPDRQAYVRVLRAEFSRWRGREMLVAVNVCGVECHKNLRPDLTDLEHSDPHPETSAVGHYRLRFASVRDLDDIFGNVREMVRDAGQIYACGSGWAHARFAELNPEICISPDNRPLDAGTSGQMLGFRCAGEPIAEAAEQPASSGG